MVPVKSLEVVARDSEAHLISLPAKAGDEFTIRYLHSVARRSVDESFEIRADGVLNLISTEWDMNGAGLPYEPEGTMVFTMDKGRYILTNINRLFPEIVQAVGTVAKHEIVYTGRSFPLEKVTPSGTAVRIRTAATPRYMNWYDNIRWRLLSHPSP
ncbi:MAG: DUF1850 domain-containing protein [bacterium]